MCRTSVVLQQEDVIRACASDIAQQILHRREYLTAISRWETYTIHVHTLQLLLALAVLVGISDMISGLVIDSFLDVSVREL